MAELTVDPSALRTAATAQETAVGDMNTAKAKITSGYDAFVWEHGPLVALETCYAYKKMLNARKKAADLTAQISLKLAYNLRNAAADYETAEAQNVNSLNNQMLRK